MGRHLSGGWASVYWYGIIDQIFIVPFSTWFVAATWSTFCNTATLPPLSALTKEGDTLPLDTHSYPATCCWSTTSSTHIQVIFQSFIDPSNLPIALPALMASAILCDFSSKFSPLYYVRTSTGKLLWSPLGVGFRVLTWNNSAFGALESITLCVSGARDSRLAHREGSIGTPGII